MLHVLVMADKYPVGAFAHGASAAVMAIVWSTAMISPDYRMHLLFLGAVRIKYIALGLLFLDLIGSSSGINTGGHLAHIGGAIFGMLYVYLLRNGTDLAAPFNRIGRFSFSRSGDVKPTKTSRNKFKVVHNSSLEDTENNPNSSKDKQLELDRILDKINAEGYDKLTAAEKEFLYRASKNK